MPEATSYGFTFQELAEAMIKYQNLHEGHWQISVEFGISAGNIQTGENQFSPSAIVPIVGISLMRVPQKQPLSVDAAEVNPA